MRRWGKILEIAIIMLIPCIAVATTPETVMLWSDVDKIEIGEEATVYLSYLPNDISFNDIVMTVNNLSIDEIEDDSDNTEEEIACDYSFKVIGAQKGKGTITAKYNNKTIANFVITVNEVQPKTIILSEETVKMELGSNYAITAEILPENAAMKTVKWSSSDQKIVSVANGKLTARGIGTAKITATAVNGIESTVDVTVVKETGKLKVTATAKQGPQNHVGKNWSKLMMVNDENITKKSTTITAQIGQKIKLYAEMTEDDKIPDVGRESDFIIVTQELLLKGATITQKVDVRENAGRYSGCVCTWTVTYKIVPVK